jgi:hydrogenase/urease accessory protein HupE
MRAGLRFEWRVAVLGLTAAVCLILLAPATALAHSIGESAADDSIPEFIPLGIEHMLLGWDHLLFIGGVVLLAGELRRAAKLITLFVLGHSLTLLVATLAGWQLSATFVDVVIVLSVVYVAVLGLIEWRDWRIIGATIFGFGLIHGLGLSTRLQDLGLPDDGLVWRVLAFNLGVEIGQLAALTVIVGVLALIARQLREPARAQIRQTAFILLLGAGLVGGTVVAATAGEEETVAVAGCSESANSSLPAFAAGGGHPEKNFFGPDEEAPTEDMAHVIHDGYVIVRYRANLPPADVTKLENWTAQNDDLAVIVAPHTTQKDAVEATTRERKLTCRRVTVEALTDFRESWFDRVRTG